MKETFRTQNDDIPQASESRFRALTNDSPIIIWTADPSGQIEFINRAYHDFFGVTLDEVQSGGWQPVVDPQDILRYSQLFMDSLRAQRAFRAQILVRRFDGQARWIETAAQPRYSESGEFLGLAGSSWDVTEQKQAEEDLRASEARFRQLADAMPHLVFTAKPDGTVDYLNKRAQGLQGAQLGPIQDWALALLHPEEVKPVIEATLPAFMEGKSFEVEHRLKQGDGSYRWHLSRCVPGYDQQGQLTGWFGSATDIHDQKMVEEQLHAAYARLRGLVNANLVGIIIGSGQGDGITEANDYFLNLLGYTRQEFEAGLLNMVERTPAEYLPADTAAFSELERDGICAPYEKEYFRKDGSRVWVLISFAFLRSKEFVAFVLDITQRKQAEQALREGLERFQIALKQAGVTAFSQDRELQYIWDYNPHPVISSLDRFGRRITDLFNDEDAEQFIDIERRVLETGQETRCEASMLLDDDMHYYDVVLTPVKDSRGEISGLYGSALDITEQKRAEASIKSYTKRLRQSNKDLEDFAFIASHDLKEPLRKIISFINLIEKGPNLSETEKEQLKRVQDAARRMQKMVDSLYELSRISTHPNPYEQVDLYLVSKTTLDDLESRLAQSKGQVLIDPLPTIEADPVQMHRLFQNLIGNALKFHKPNNPPQVQIGCRYPIPGKVEIYVQDNGIGFDMQFVEKIFRPFERLNGHKNYEGAGLGLAICQRIVERHGGHIGAHSVPGEGSVFSIVLPIKQI